MKTKICSNCKIELPISSFGPDKRRKSDGTKAVCRPCDREIHRARYYDPAKVEYKSKALHKNNIWRSKNAARRRDLGLCANCTKPSLPGRSRCAEHAEAARVRQNDRFHSAKNECFEAYGGYVCACCGETEKAFLTMDHPNNDGARHREILFGKRGAPGSYVTDIYRWVRDAGFPEGLLQVLCFNCNCGRHRNGGVCPHKSRVAA